MAHHPKELTDSQKELKAIVAEAFEEATGDEPPPSDSSENIRRISRDEAHRTCRELIAEYQNKCVTTGPIAVVWKEIDKMRDANVARDKQMAEFLGAQKLTRWLVPVVTSVLTSSLAVFLISRMIAGMHK